MIQSKMENAYFSMNSWVHLMNQMWYWFKCVKKRSSDDQCVFVHSLSLTTGAFFFRKVNFSYKVNIFPKSACSYWTCAHAIRKNYRTIYPNAFQIRNCTYLNWNDVVLVICRFFFLCCCLWFLCVCVCTHSFKPASALFFSIRIFEFIFYSFALM